MNYNAFLRENGDLVNLFLNYFTNGCRLLHTAVMKRKRGKENE